ncbi:single-stranded DNA-binding protein [Mycolicibacterium sp. GCM10028919]|uniref:single-stranded DNA-binding protein n=1 Tax=Mycolicibacterium sp. GCM10028919 TaxID=3273401 RepID=UPI00360F7610
MFETPIALVGNIVSEPVRRRVGEQDLTRLRVASNSRRKAADGSWQAGDTLYVTVSCWGALALGAGGSLVKGDPVVVVGHLYTNEYDDKEGNKRSTNEIRAISVGPDLARSVARITSTRRLVGVGPGAGESVTESAETDVDPDDVDDDGSDGMADGSASDAGLTLTA